MQPRRIYHVACESAFREHVVEGAYRPADLPREGFVHCVLQPLVLSVANDWFGDADETVLLLEIDPSRLGCETLYQPADRDEDTGRTSAGTASLFPHVYGPIELESIVQIGALVRSPDGYGWPEKMTSCDAFLRSA